MTENFINIYVYLYNGKEFIQKNQCNAVNLKIKLKKNKSSLDGFNGRIEVRE